MSRRPGPVHLLLCGALALSACDPAPPTGVLPDALAVAAVVDAGGPAGPEPVSLLVTLPRPGVEPAVRLLPGVAAMDLGFAATVEHAPDGGLRLERLGPEGGVWEGRTTPGARLVRVDRDGVVVEDADGQVQLSWTGQEARLATPVDGMGGEATHPGPAGGFEARVDDDGLHIGLPRDRGEPVLDGVEAVLGCWWLRMADLPPWQRRVVDDAFKQVAVLAVAPGTATLDGDLADWADTMAVRVDSPGQLLSGQADWGGARDGGFGVAVRQDADGGLVLGVRIRDDQLVEGADRLLLDGPDLAVGVPLVAAGGAQEEAGLRAVIGPRDGREQAVEVHLPGLEAADVVALRVSFVDADPGQPEPTVMSTAPGSAALRLGRHVHRPEAPARRPGR